MKSKALKKRLVLNKETVSDLCITEMGDLYGGHDSSPTCPAFTKYDCISVYVCQPTKEVCTDPIFCTDIC